MAGILSAENVPCCSGHNWPCYIKTGTREGPNRGKSFFICSREKNQCSFVQGIQSFEANFCPKHGEMNELHALNVRKDHERYYYRCIKGRQESMSWCGFEILSQGKMEKPARSVLSDLSNVFREKPVTKTSENPFGSVISKDVKKSIHPDLDFQLGRTEDVKSREEKEIITKDVSPPAVVVCLSEQDSQLSGFEREKQKPLPSSHGFAVEPIVISDDEEDDGHPEQQLKSNQLVALDGKKPQLQTGNAAGDGDEDAVPSLRDRLGKERLLADVKRKEKKEETEEKAISSALAEVDPATLKIVRTMTTQEIEQEIVRQEGIKKSIRLEFLPDNGQKIFARIERLKEALKYVKEHRGLEMPRYTGSITQRQPGSRPGGTVFLEIGRGEGREHSTSGQQYGKLSKTAEMAKITNEAIVELHRSLERCPDPSAESGDPSGLNVTLMTHQRQALKWLQWRERQKPSGGILADDMGLGKTLTMISLILKDKSKPFTRKDPPALKLARGSLVICPASLVHQWKKEIDQRVKPFLLSVCVYHGPNREKKLDRLCRYDVVLTTYSVVGIEAKPLIQSREAKKVASEEDEGQFTEKQDSEWKATSNGAPAKEQAKSLLLRAYWRRVILDEAHNIKNHKSLTSSATCLLESDSRWAVTGTPIQNDTMDLYSILKFLHCSPFDDIKVWKRHIEDKSKRGMDKMNVIVKSLLLRRTKSQQDMHGKPLVSLPERKSHSHVLALSHDEKEVYELLHAFSRNILCIYLEDREMKAAGAVPRADPSERQLFDPEKIVLGRTSTEVLQMLNVLHKPASSGVILFMVLRLRQCCSHLSLMCQRTEDEGKIEDSIELPIEEQLQNMSLCDVENDSPREREISTRSIPVQLEKSFISTKLGALMKQLELLLDTPSDRKPVKSVIVSQWTKMLDIVANQLIQRGVRHAFITGSVPAKMRSELVDKFNNDLYGPQVMLVSLKAGGVGLNLIGGNHLFLLDQHWNPALEDQATDRVYRVGQKKNVFIHRFLCQETIEEKITKLQEKKQRIAENVLAGGKGGKQKLTLDDLKTIFGI